MFVPGAGRLLLFKRLYLLTQYIMIKPTKDTTPITGTRDRKKLVKTQVFITNMYSFPNSNSIPS